MYLPLFVEFDCRILHIKSFVLDAICPLFLDLIVMYTSSLCWIWLSYTLLIKSFVLDTICPLLLDLIVMYTSTISIHPLLVEFDCRLYFTNLIFRPWWYPPSPSWLDCSVYLGPNPIHLLVEFTYLIFRRWWYPSSPPRLDCHVSSSLCWIWLSYTSHQIFCPRCYLSSLPRLDCHVYFLSLLNLIVIYFTNQILRPRYYMSSPPRLDCHVYLDYKYPSSPRWIWLSFILY